MARVVLRRLALVASIFFPSMAYLQDVLGFTALAAGTAFIAYSCGVMVAANQLGPTRAIPVVGWPLPPRWPSAARPR